MTAPRPRPTHRLTREQAFSHLAEAGFPNITLTTNIGIVAPLRTVMVAIGEAESDLFVDAVGLPNPDGSQDFGWLQINSIHGENTDRILADAAFTADIGFDLYSARGLRPWAAYGREWPEETPPYRYLRRMPPTYGGPVLKKGMSGLLLINSLQAFLNGRIEAGLLAGAALVPLVVDGGYGPKTQVVVTEWKRRHFNDGSADVNARTWARMETQGLR